MDTATFFIKNRLLAWILVLISLVWGGLAYLEMPRFEDPEFLIRTAQIVTEYPGAFPETVADEINDPIESEVQGMQEVNEIRSTSYYGYSVIEVDIKHAFAPDREALNLIWTRLRAKVDNSVRDLPPGAGVPIVNDDYGDVFGLYYLITGEGFSIQELEEYAKDLRKDLLAVDGVAKVSTLGEQPEGIYLEISQARVAALAVSLERVFDSLAQQNSVTRAGTVVVGEQRLVIHPKGEIDSVQAIASVMVPIGDGSELVPLSEIATVKREVLEPAFLKTRYNGEPAIALGISNVSGANVAKLGEAIRDTLDATLEQRPYGIEVHEFYHQGDAVNQAVESFAVNVLAALGIVLVTLFIFMGMRSAIVIGTVLTITIGATLATMYVVEIPMHRISLGALIIALGMLVDNAIVVTEGILTGTRSGRSVLASAKDVVGKTKWALLGGTAVGIVAFAPIGFAPGDTAEYTNHLFWVIMISLLYSWIFAITLAPMLADVVFAETGSALATEASKESRMMLAYKGFLKGALGARWGVVGVCLGLFLVSIWGFKYVEEGFFPTSTTPQIAIDYWLPESTDIAFTSRDVALIVQEISEYEGVESVHSVVGAGALRYMLIYSPENPNGAYAQLILRVKDLEQIEPLMPKIQTYLDAEFPQAQARVWRFTLGPSQGSKIEAAFRGPDPTVLRQLANEATEIMQRHPDAVAVKTDWRQRVPVAEPEYDPARGGRVGVSREAFSAAINRHYDGETVGVYRESDTLIPIIARSPTSERDSLGRMKEIQVVSQLTGIATPMSEVLKETEVTWKNGQMLREDRVWTLKVQADPIAGVLPSSILADIRPQIEAIELPPGYSLRWDGEYGDSEKANAELAQTLPLGLLSMVLIVVVLFNAIKQASVIWLTVPLALVGVVLGLVITSTALEFMAILGLLSLSGLLIKNAIVLVDQMDFEIRDGKPRYDAVIDSAASRVRPVMMGALTTILGVIPLLGDVFFASMAVVIVFGLTFATLLTLVVVPALYAIFFGIHPGETAAVDVTSAAT